MTTTPLEVPPSDSIWHPFFKLIESIAPSFSSGHNPAAACVISDVDVPTRWLIDDEVLVTVDLRRRGSDDKPERSVQALSDVFILPVGDFEVMGMGAPADCTSFYAAAVAGNASGVHMALVMDWRRVGRALASERVIAAGPNAGRKIGEVLRSGAARSGVPAVNQRRQRAIDRLVAEDSHTRTPDEFNVYNLVRDIMIEESLAYDAEDEVDDGSPKSFWLLVRQPGIEADVEVLSISPDAVGERNRAGALADRITNALAVEAWQATRDDRKDVWTLSISGSSDRDTEADIDGDPYDEEIEPSDPTPYDGRQRANAESHKSKHGPGQWCDCLKPCPHHPHSDPTPNAGMALAGAQTMIARLTTVEFNVLRAMIEGGLTNREVATKFGCSPQYVGQVLRRVKDKYPDGYGAPTVDALGAVLGLEQYLDVS